MQRRTLITLLAALTGGAVLPTWAQVGSKDEAPDALIKRLSTDLLELVQWDKGNGAVLVVGHQPLLGQTAAHLLGLGQEACSIRKGAVWWLRRRQRLEHNQTVLMAVMCPEFL